MVNGPTLLFGQHFQKSDFWRDFWTKYFFPQDFEFWTLFLTKILSITENLFAEIGLLKLDCWSKFDFFQENFDFWEKFQFWRKFLFLIHISIFGQNFYVLRKRFWNDYRRLRVGKKSTKKSVNKHALVNPWLMAQH